MKIRWRLHETLLGAAITVEFIIAIILRDQHFTPGILKTLYEDPFTQKQVSFSYIRNIFLPDALMAVTMFTCQLYFNQYIITLVNKKKLFTKAFVHLLLLWLLLLIVSTLSTYWLSEYDFISPLGNNKPLLVALQNGTAVSLGILLPYLAYVLVREWIIFKIETGKQRAFQTLVANRLSGITAIYLAILSFVILFRIEYGSAFFVPFLFYIPTFILSFFILLYGVFPNMNQENIASRNNLIRIIASIIFIAVPFGLMYKMAMTVNGSMIRFLLVCWAVQLFLITPLAWMVYQRQKKQFDYLRGLQTKLEQSGAELMFLRSQMNPHFLFNALNTIYGTALEENANKTAEAVQKLGDMVRFHINENPSDKIELSQEQKYLADYISLQRLRIPESAPVTIESDLDNIAYNHIIEPMLLIPFVENAFKHGISFQHNSFIRVKLRSDQKSIHFTVENSVHAAREKDPEKNRKGIGLENVQRRLNILYPEYHRLNIQSNSNIFSINLVITLK